MMDPAPSKAKLKRAFAEEPSLDLTDMNHWEKLAQAAQVVVEETVGGLPEEIRPHAERVPISLENMPTKGMREEGIDEDTLGLFVGESFEDAGTSLSPMPGQILLFLGNIWEFADEEMDAYREEVRVTLLHELGHYFGWDEQDLFDRDLD